MNVAQLSSNVFRITVNLVEDSLSGFDTSIFVNVIENSTNQFIKTKSVKVNNKRAFHGFLNYGTSSSFQIKTFIDTIFLPTSNNGYYLNVNDSSLTRNSVNYIPGKFILNCETTSTSISGGNSNPTFDNFDFDSLFLQLNSRRILDFSCTDIDGDSLVYKLTQSVRSTSTNEKKPYSNAPWASGFHTSFVTGPGSICHLLTSSPAGFLEASFARNGSYIIAVTCGEYRNGIKIGSITRDVNLIGFHNLPSSIPENGLNSSISVYPNPNNGIFNLNIKDIDDSISSMKVYSLSGQLIQIKKSLNANNKINLNSVDKGIYFIHIESGNESVVKKIIIN